MSLIGKDRNNFGKVHGRGYTVCIITSQRHDFDRLVPLLEGHRFAVRFASSGEDGLEMVRARRWSLIVIDHALPGMDGVDVCRELKRDRMTSYMPVIMVSTRSEEADIVAALEIGADDYLIKPFSSRVLLSKIRAILRQVPSTPHPANELIEIHGIAIHPGRHEVRIGDREVGLTVTEFELLHFLARNPGKAFRREEILRALRGDGNPTSERAVDVQVAGLRRRLGSYGNRIETVRGVGYRLRIH